MRGRKPEFRYSTRSLETQRLLIDALSAYKKLSNNPLIYKEIKELQRLIQDRREYMVNNLFERYGLEIPNQWIDEDNTNNTR